MKACGERGMHRWPVSSLDPIPAAWHLMTDTKRGCVLYQDKAREVGTSLTVAPPLDEYLGGADLDLGLAGQHQRVNAALAVTLAAAWEARYAQVCLPP